MAGVRKRFGPVEALRGVDLAVAPGTVLALLGPNGAGKSTLIRVAATTVLPDAGTVKVGGYDVVHHPTKARARLGIVLNEERSFYWRLSGRENLRFFVAFHGLRGRAAAERVEEVLAAVGLDEPADRRVDRYSSGMRARLGLARGLLGRPDVLLLDEPTRSLDPAASIAIRELVRKLADARGAAVLFVTHDLHEAAEVASSIVVLHAGQVVAEAEGGTDAAALEQLFLEGTR